MNYYNSGANELSDEDNYLTKHNKSKTVMRNIDKNRLIEAYHRGTLKGADKAYLKQLMSEDPSFKQEVKDYKQIYKGLEALHIEQFQLNLNKMEAKYETKDNVVAMPLMEKTPTAGKVVDTKKLTKNDLNITEYTLSNGVRVILKPTDFKNDQILLTAYSPGGHSLYADKDFVTAQNAANIIDEAGLGAFDQIALEKKLTGASIQIGPYIGERYEGFSGSSSVEDFETMLKLIHLYGTNPRKDKESFTRVMDQTKEELRNLSANPMLYFQTEIQKIKTNNHPRRKDIPSEEDLDKIDFERVHEIYKDRFSDFSDFTFVLVGNFEPEKIKAPLALYLGSLPSTNRKEQGKDVGVTYPTKTSTNNLKKGLAPQANVYMGFVQED